MTSNAFFDERLRGLAGGYPSAERISSGLDFAEGPVWNLADGSLNFSDIPRETIHRWTREEGASVFRKPSGGANGNTRDPDGNLLSCEHLNRRVSRTQPDGRVVSVASHFEGKRLNSPNDVVCASNGDVFFTDPPYGLRQPDGSFLPGELPFAGVFCRRAGSEEMLLISDRLVKPNGIVLTDDGSRLFVADTDNHVVHFFDLAPDRSVLGSGVFSDLSHAGREGRPDGMKLDSRGNLYVCANGEEGIWVFDGSGALLGFLGVPEPPSNLAWGEETWTTLFVTARSSVYRIPLQVAGQPLAS